VSETDHERLQNGGNRIAKKGEEIRDAVKPLYADLAALVPHFGNPETDEVAALFRRGEGGHPGFDSAHQGLKEAVANLSESYAAIGAALKKMSENVKGAEWASALKAVDENGSVQDVIDFGARKDDGVPQLKTLAESD
jgi:uncharacterized protein YukE